MPCACCETGRCCNGWHCNSLTVSGCASSGGSFTAGGNCTQYACTATGPSYSGGCYLADACQCNSDGRNLNVPYTTCNCATLYTAGVPYGGCSASQKCCGPSGCLYTSPTAFTVNVAVNDWVDTGVTIAAGEGVSITATGTVYWALPGSATAGPNGVSSGCAANRACDRDAGLMEVCHMALIGRIGTAGTKFLVGASYSGTPGAGRLYLRQNDACVSDNSGSFTGTITTDPCPGYTPAAIGEPIVYAAGEEPPKPGPGAEIKRLLSLVGIVSSPTCSCNARAAQMDAWGEWESIRRLPEICDWLKEEADKREMWFFRPAGYALVLAAVLLAALKRPFRGNNQ